MLRLYVMRHAKSSWAVPGARDFDRELNDRGVSDLVLVAKELRSNSYLPEKVLCSPAERTRQTLDGIRPALNDSTEIAFEQRLYSGGLEDYMTLIREEKTTSSLMTIGHNPMSGSVAFSLVGGGDPELVELISYKYPTACVAVIDFDSSSWSEIGKRSGTLVDCIIPSRLKGKDH